MLAERIPQWEQEFYQKGIQQGISEGLSQGLYSQQSTLIDMLTDRFGEVPQNWQQDITQIKETDTLRNLIRAVYKVASADEFSGLLQGCSKVQ